MYVSKTLSHMLLSGVMVYVCDLNLIIIIVLNVEMITSEAQTGVAGTFKGIFWIF